MVRLRNRQITTSTSSKEDDQLSIQGHPDKKQQRAGRRQQHARVPLGPEIRGVTGERETRRVERPALQPILQPSSQPQRPPRTNKNLAHSTHLRNDINRNRIARPTSPPPPPPSGRPNNGFIPMVHFEQPAFTHPRVVQFDQPATNPQPHTRNIFDTINPPLDQNRVVGTILPLNSNYGKKRPAPMPPSQRSLARLLNNKRRAPPPPIMEVSDDCERESPTPPASPTPEDPPVDYEIETEANPETKTVIETETKTGEAAPKEEEDIFIQAPGSYEASDSEEYDGIYSQLGEASTRPESSIATADTEDGILPPDERELPEQSHVVEVIYSVPNKATKKKKPSAHDLLMAEIRQKGEERAERNIEFKEPERKMTAQAQMLREIVAVSHQRQDRRAAGALIMRNVDGRGSKTFKEKEHDLKKRISEGFKSPMATGRPVSINAEDECSQEGMSSKDGSEEEEEAMIKLIELAAEDEESWSPQQDLPYDEADDLGKELTARVANEPTFFHIFTELSDTEVPKRRKKIRIKNSNLKKIHSSMKTMLGSLGKSFAKKNKLKELMEGNWVIYHTQKYDDPPPGAIAVERVEKRPAYAYNETKDKLMLIPDYERVIITKEGLTIRESALTKVEKVNKTERVHTSTVIAKGVPVSVEAIRNRENKLEHEREIHEVIEKQMDEVRNRKKRESHIREIIEAGQDTNDRPERQMVSTFTPDPPQDIAPSWHDQFSGTLTSEKSVTSHSDLSSMASLNDEEERKSNLRLKERMRLQRHCQIGSQNPLYTSEDEDSSTEGDDEKSVLPNSSFSDDDSTQNIDNASDVTIPVAEIVPAPIPVESIPEIATPMQDIVPAANKEADMEEATPPEIKEEPTPEMAPSVVDIVPVNNKEKPVPQMAVEQPVPEVQAAAPTTPIYIMPMPMYTPYPGITPIQIQQIPPTVVPQVQQISPAPLGAKPISDAEFKQLLQNPQQVSPSIVPQVQQIPIQPVSHVQQVQPGTIPQVQQVSPGPIAAKPISPEEFQQLLQNPPQQPYRATPLIQTQQFVQQPAFNAANTSYAAKLNNFINNEDNRASVTEKIVNHEPQVSDHVETFVGEKISETPETKMSNDLSGQSSASDVGPPKADEDEIPSSLIPSSPLSAEEDVKVSFADEEESEADSEEDNNNQPDIAIVTNEQDVDNSAPEESNGCSFGLLGSTSRPTSIQTVTSEVAKDDNNEPEVVIATEEQQNVKETSILNEPVRDVQSGDDMSRPSSIFVQSYQSNSRPSSIIVPVYHSDSRPSSTVVADCQSNSRPSSTVVPEYQSDSRPPSIVALECQSDSRPSSPVVSRYQIDSTPPSNVIPQCHSNSRPSSIVAPEYQDGSRPSSIIVPEYKSDSRPESIVKPESNEGSLCVLGLTHEPTQTMADTNDIALCPDEATPDALNIPTSFNDLLSAMQQPSSGSIKPGELGRNQPVENVLNEDGSIPKADPEVALVESPLPPSVPQQCGRISPSPSPPSSPTPVRSESPAPMSWATRFGLNDGPIDDAQPTPPKPTPGFSCVPPISTYDAVSDFNSDPIGSVQPSPESPIPPALLPRPLSDFSDEPIPEVPVSQPSWSPTPPPLPPPIIAASPLNAEPMTDTQPSEVSQAQPSPTLTSTPSPLHSESTQAPAPPAPPPPPPPPPPLPPTNFRIAPTKSTSCSPAPTPKRSSPPANANPQADFMEELKKRLQIRPFNNNAPQGFRRINFNSTSFKAKKPEVNGSALPPPPWVKRRESLRDEE